MGIWIRSQDKTILIEANVFKVGGTSELDVNGNVIDRWYVIAIYLDNYDDVGQYSSKEKAMKVLDLIQNKILKLNYLADPIQYDYDTVETFNCANTPKVFQMPRDDEVK